VKVGKGESGLNLDICPGAPEFLVTPLPAYPIAAPVMMLPARRTRGRMILRLTRSDARPRHSVATTHVTSSPETPSSLPLRRTETD